MIAQHQKIRRGGKTYRAVKKPAVASVNKKPQELSLKPKLN